MFLLAALSTDEKMGCVTIAGIAISIAISQGINWFINRRKNK